MSKTKCPYCEQTYITFEGFGDSEIFDCCSLASPLCRCNSKGDTFDCKFIHHTPWRKESQYEILKQNSERGW